MSVVQKRILARALILLVGIVHIYPFLAGYRLTADDVAYHWYAMNGLEASWDFIRSAAIDQGRIVHFPDLVTSLFGAYYADNLPFRISYTLLYFLNFGLFAYYLSTVSRSNAGWFFLLILLVLHPLDFHHTSPGSYPLKISFPIFFIMISRISINYIRIKYLISRKKKTEAPWILLCLAAMMFSEYAFLFASSLMLIEFVMRIIDERDDSTKPVLTLIVENAKSWKTIKDVLTVLTFLGSYFLFRLIHPSNYEGNQLPDQFTTIAFIKTMIGHILGGSIISTFFRYENFTGDLQGSIGRFGYFTLILLPISTFFSSLLLLGEYRLGSQLKLDPKKLKTAFCFALALALIVTAPVAITEKYQSWCGEIGNCIFLDSSLSYLGFGVCLAILLLGLANFATRALTPGLYFFCAFLACTAAVTQQNNLLRGVSMTEYVQGWERAKLIACYSRVDLTNLSEIEKLVEPVPLISMHPNFDAQKYWSLYIKDMRMRCP